MSKSSKRVDRIQEMIDDLDGCLTAHYLLKQVYNEIDTGNVTMSIQLRIKLDNYFEVDDSE